MKKVIALFASLTFLFISNSTRAQQNIAASDSINKRPQAFYFEILGIGGLYSVNYDTRFTAKPDGLGIRGGISYTQVSDISLFTLPVQLNYLLGKSEKYFEIGLGATYASAALDMFEDENDASGSTVFGTMTFGYRKQPLDGGFMFRGGVSPVFGKGYFIPYYPYLSFGYSF